MQFLKKHYEKIVLGVVLLGVAATSLLLTMRAGDERQKLAEQLQQKVGGKQKPLKPVELAGSMASLERLSKASVVTLSGEHKTFNPGTWIRKADATIAPVGDKGGRGAEGLCAARREVGLEEGILAAAVPERQVQRAQQPHGREVHVERRREAARLAREVRGEDDAAHARLAAAGLAHQQHLVLAHGRGGAAHSGPLARATRPPAGPQQRRTRA